MKILIVSATNFEMHPLLNQMGVGSSAEHFISLKYKNSEIDILITGMGMVPTAYYVGKKLNASYDFALNTGICGSFNANLEIGDVVNITSDCFSELGAEDGDTFLTLDELNLKGAPTVINNGSHSRRDFFSKHLIELLPKVNGITVNTVHGNENSIEKAVHKFHPIVESMEGAAFMFACEQERVPYAQIRAVSNYVERRNKESWNIPLAIENLNKKVLEILDDLII